jgi:crossover junction endodeoxyribonuclease RusA
MKIELFLPFPPSINSYYVKTRNGVFISASGKAYHKRVLEDIKEQCGPMKPISIYVHLSVVLFMPDKRKRDLDNYMKPLLDSLTRCAFYEDDSLVNQLFVYRGAPQLCGSVFIRVSDAAPSVSLEHLRLIE